MERSAYVSPLELVHALRRIGYSADVTAEIAAAQLPDPLDIDGARRVLERYGITRERLMDLMGASP